MKQTWKTKAMTTLIESRVKDLFGEWCRQPGNKPAEEQATAALVVWMAIPKRLRSIIKERAVLGEPLAEQELTDLWRQFLDGQFHSALDSVAAEAVASLPDANGNGTGRAAG